VVASGGRRYDEHMSDAVAADRKATEPEVRAHAPEIRRLADELGLATPLLRKDGTLVIHASDRGYRAANRLSAAASGVVGAYVHVITDDVPGAVPVRPL
jgi:hypothetical protein